MLRKPPCSPRPPFSTKKNNKRLAEILSNTEQEAASNLNELVKGGGRKRSSPSVRVVFVFVFVFCFCCR